MCAVFPWFQPLSKICRIHWRPQWISARNHVRVFLGACHTRCAFSGVMWDESTTCSDCQWPVGVLVVGVGQTTKVRQLMLPTCSWVSSAPLQAGHQRTCTVHSLMQFCFAKRSGEVPQWLLDVVKGLEKKIKVVKSTRIDVAFAGLKECIMNTDMAVHYSYMNLAFMAIQEQIEVRLGTHHITDHDITSHRIPDHFDCRYLDWVGQQISSYNGSTLPGPVLDLQYPRIRPVRACWFRRSRKRNWTWTASRPLSTACHLRQSRWWLPSSRNTVLVEIAWVSLGGRITPSDLVWAMTNRIDMDWSSIFLFLTRSCQTWPGFNIEIFASCRYPHHFASTSGRSDLLFPPHWSSFSCSPRRGQWRMRHTWVPWNPSSAKICKKNLDRCWLSSPRPNFWTFSM